MSLWKGPYGTPRMSCLFLSVQPNPTQLVRLPAASLPPSGRPRDLLLSGFLTQPPQRAADTLGSYRPATEALGVRTEGYPKHPSSSPKQTVSSVSKSPLKRQAESTDLTNNSISWSHLITEWPKCPGCLFLSLFTEFQISLYNIGPRQPRKSHPSE